MFNDVINHTKPTLTLRYCSTYVDKSTDNLLPSPSHIPVVNIFTHSQGELHAFNSIHNRGEQR